MRKMALSLIPFVALALAGCNSSSSSSDGAPASASTAGAAKVANEVSGTVTLRAPAQPLSPKASLSIKVADVSSTADASAPPLALKLITPATQFPLPFTLNFDPTKVKPNDIYVVQAELNDGDRHYVMKIQALVLTNGNKNDGVNIELSSEPTAGEKVLAAFTDVQKQLGAMKVKSGTKLDKDVSRSWQVFRQDNDLKFIRELVDYGAKGFTSTDYAYKNGKPWVIVQQTKPNQGAKPTAIDRAGWDDNGNLVLKQHEVNGDVQPLDDSTASSLRKQATDVLTLATGGKDK
jgi:putative lipoprotein